MSHEHTCLPLIPPEVIEEAEAAERRKIEALDRLQRLAEEAPPHQPHEPDALEHALQGVIDADKAYQEARKR